MKAVVTGAAGFIGSHLVGALHSRGAEIVSIDCFTPYYPEAAKRANVATNPGGVIEADLRHDDLMPLVEGADVVFHLAAQPGVRMSWADGFAEYDSHNIAALQRVLEAVREAGTPRLVFASSSSVYGNAERYPTVETDHPRPHSPYGVTKLAGEHLCDAYATNFGVSTVALRYFTVYGPRQRPDMAFHRLCESALTGAPFPLYGDGSQIRDFTYVSDVIAATIAAGEADVAPGTICNVAGGTSTDMRSVFTLVGALAGSEVVLDRRPGQAGDVRRTGGDTALARSLLGWEPRVSLEEGLASQLAWHRERR